MQMLLAVVETLDHALFILTRESRVAFCNGLARDWFRQSGRIRRRSAVLYLDGEPAVAQIQRSDAVAPGTHVMVVRESGRTDEPRNQTPCYRLMLTARVFRRKTENAAILRIYDANQRRDIPLLALRQLYQLTQAESQVARHLFTGEPLGAVAQVLGIAIGTARTHVKRILSKCEVRSQAELVRLFRSGPSLPGDARIPHLGDASGLIQT